MSFLEKLLGGDGNARQIKQLQPAVDQINGLEDKVQVLSDDDLKKKTDEFKGRFDKGESLDDLLPEAFAVAREAAKRVLGERAYDTQLMGGIVLHQGKISELKTGEGKTLAAVLAVYLNALPGKGVHVVTVNDYLAKRDAEWMGKIYKFLGLSVGSILHGQTPAERKEMYTKDIVYGTNNEFGFDYLRDNMAIRSDNLVQRELNFAIVDEVDSILIDEARTPLIISAPDEESTEYYKRFSQLVPGLAAGVDYDVDEKLKSVVLTEGGINKVENLLGIKDIYESGDITLAHHINQALKAYALFKKDRDYVVKDGEVVIVDEFTGRLMVGRRYSEGLHQAIEAKEGVEVRRESKTLATITFQNYFRLYEKLSGMTGTAKTEEEEFYKIYGLEVIVVPTNKPLVRDDMNDLIYVNEAAKFKAAVVQIKEMHKKGQPVLVGTIAIEKSELLSDMLKQEGVVHNVLNAKHHEKEAEIVKDAGKKGAVTIATNMAGRGTDIKLGEGVRELGGLHILGTERHESRRIDNQLRGRAGRQGDPGSTQFLISLEDDLMRLFGTERMKSMMKTLKVPEDMPIEHKMISGSIEAAQKKVEGHNFDIRKHVVQYDDVMNRQRTAIYRQRREILLAESLGDKIWEMAEKEIEAIVNFHVVGIDTKTWELDKMISSLKQWFEVSEDETKKIKDLKDPDEMIKFISEKAKEVYESKKKEAGDETWNQVEKSVYLRIIDVLWVEHLDAMVKMREGISLSGYAQKDPLAEYKQEAYTMYQRLLGAISGDVVQMIFRVKIQSIEEQQVMKEKRQLAFKGAKEPKGDFKDEAKELDKKASSSSNTVNKKKKVGRNDPCPCGSGKKYKKCHGA
ncbi:MAG: preprotein translocase subunit SecA [Patescibacteria group bacterium]|nr:preprotein translocase subunit SecA [Patescibacteria group bacterium]